MTTRRQFLSDCSTIALAAGVAPASVLAGPTRQREVSIGRIDFAAFAEQLNTTFVVRDPLAVEVELKLIKATPRPVSHPGNPKAQDAANEKFSLVFRGPRHQPLRQYNHQFDHAKLGTFAMLIVPVIARDQEHFYYEAIFNRPAAQGARMS